MPAGTGIRRRRRAVEAVTRSSTHSKSGKKKIDSEGADVKSGHVSGHPGVQLLTPFSPSHIDDNPSSSAHSGHGSVPPRGRGGQRLRGMAGVGQSARHGRGQSEREAWPWSVRARDTRVQGYPSQRTDRQQLQHPHAPTTDHNTHK